MDILVNLLVLLISLVALNYSSHLTVTNAIKVSDITGLGKMAVGFILIAFSTSLPELSVAIFAAFGGEGAISVGNVIGSNIVNVCLVIGLAAILVALTRRSRTAQIIPTMAKEEFGSIYFGLFVGSIIPLSLVYLASAGWFVGLILLLIFGVQTYQLSKIRIPPEEGEGVSEDMRRKLHSYVVLTFAGVAGVVISAHFLVESAVVIAEFAGLSKALIGATIVAFGTSLPEFAVDVKAFLKGHSALALGEIVGSCFINITLILGVTLVASPFTVGNVAFFIDLVIFSLIANLFLWYFLSLERLGWKEGIILLFIYLLFLATTLGVISLNPQ